MLLCPLCQLNAQATVLLTLQPKIASYKSGQKLFKNDPVKSSIICRTLGTKRCVSSITLRGRL